MTLLEYYQRKVASGEILEDSQQIFALQKFQTLYDNLIAKKSLFQHFSKEVSRGLYLWGSVGIGKTFLMDTFYHFLPFQDKWRTHFLPFMHEVHAQLTSLQGTKDPLFKIAENWAKKTRIICFDEFAVNDIADALILGNLLDAFFAQKIVMIFTSNLPPDELYKNGIQRELFLPTIEKIKTHTEIVHLTPLDDYRARYPTHAQYYWHPLTTLTRKKMEETFSVFTKGAIPSSEPLVLYDRKIPVQKMAGNVIWFDFLDICGIPRSKEDYLLIVQKFNTVFISNLLPIRPSENDLVRSFIQLVDIFYESKTRLVISAALPIEEIYTSGILSFEFNRTRSRITQMQSAEWSANFHAS